MRLLFTIDSKDYKEDGTRFVRPSARAIIVRDGKIAMIRSKVFDFYKFPGGGLENNEDPIEALKREAEEEAALKVIPSSIKEFGLVKLLGKDHDHGADFFEQDNYYYLCEAEDESTSQNLDDYEAELEFEPVFVEPIDAIRANRARILEDKKIKHTSNMMLEREARVLEILINESNLL